MDARWMPAAPSRQRVAAGWALIGSLGGAMVAGRLEAAAFCLAVGLTGCIAFRARWPSHRWAIAVVCGFAFGWALNLYLTPGQPLPGWPRPFGRAATREGLALGGLLGLRLLGASASLQGLRAVWKSEQAADALIGAVAPLRRIGVPVRDLGLLMGLAVRFAPLLEREAQRIAAVQELRAGRPARTPAEWLERKRAAAVPTLVGALERADRIALALESRHYGLRSERGGPRSGGAWWGKAAGAAVFLVGLLWRHW
jgi:energy-coupling factor transporter transmembrane protein EcfT